MPSILKRITNSFRKKKSSPTHEKKLDAKPIDSDKSTTPITSNFTSITTLAKPAFKVKSKSTLTKDYVHNNHDAERCQESYKFEDNYNEITINNCLSGYSKERYVHEANKSNTKCLSGDENINSSSNARYTENFAMNIKQKLQTDYEKLQRANERIQKRYNISKELNNQLKLQVVELEKLNQKLLTDNAETLHEAIKHRFLKLESEDLSKKTNIYKQKLEDKENLIVKFQKQFENIRLKSNMAFKQKEEAQLEASHSNVKLKELADDIAELDIYKNENVQRKFYFNELQNILGNIRVYLKIKSTVSKSCISCLADEKILLTTSDNKPKRLICQFSHVFQSQSTNRDVFDEIEPLLATVIDGFNSCFISYGQLGSGKSNTMFGDQANPGILSQSLDYLMNTTDENENWDFVISLSALQINKDTVNDIIRKKVVKVVDDGSSLILQNTEERSLRNKSQCNDILTLIELNKNFYKPLQHVRRSFSHCLVIIRVVGNCKLTDEKCSGLAMFCELAGFENENNLQYADRDCLKEEKVLQDSLIDVGKTLITLKTKNRKKPRTNYILTKLLYPCLNANSKCCLIIHCFSDIDQQNTITKSIQYGLAIMPKTKEKTNDKNAIQWDFSDEDE